MVLLVSRDYQIWYCLCHVTIHMVLFGSRYYTYGIESGISPAFWRAGVYRESFRERSSTGGSSWVLLCERGGFEHSWSTHVRVTYPEQYWCYLGEVMGAQAGGWGYTSPPIILRISAQEMPFEAWKPPKITKTTNYTPNGQLWESMGAMRDVKNNEIMVSVSDSIQAACCAILR